MPTNILTQLLASFQILNSLNICNKPYQKMKELFLNLRPMKIQYSMPLERNSKPVMPPNKESLVSFIESISHPYKRQSRPMDSATKKI